MCSQASRYQKFSNLEVVKNYNFVISLAFCEIRLDTIFPWRTNGGGGGGKFLDSGYLSRKSQEEVSNSF